MSPLKPALLSLVSAAVTSAALQTRVFNPLPLGKVMPSGWLKDQLNLQVNGLAGHEMDFYNYVAQSDWIGGSSFYSNLEEAGSYWFNGLVPTGVLSGSATVQNQTTNFLNYVLAHQQSDGWIGPETGDKPKYLWGRYLFLFGAIQMVEADPSLADTVIPALYKFVSLSNTMLQENQGLEEWGEARWEEYLISLQWLYDNYPNGNEDLLMDTMSRIKSTGLDWNSVFDPSNFPTGPTENTNPPYGIISVHGVNVAEALKAGATAWRFNGQQSDLSASLSAWNITYQYHGRPSGIFAADEHLAGKDAVRGTELCLVVEAMYSGSYLYQASGMSYVADRTEKIAYNALPATLTGDMWSHQYLQQQNQIAAKDMNPNIFPTDGSYSNVFGLEPNYPCCTVNHPQGWPKFISNAFVISPDGGSLGQLYLGPFSTNVSLNNNNQVTVDVDTQYPFSDTLTMKINAAQAFTYKVRIPSWTVDGTIAVNGGTVQAVSPDNNGMHSVQVVAGETTLVMNIPASITAEERNEGAVALHRGPLHYAFDIPRNQTILATNSQQSSAKDFEFDATGAWNYAIDPSTATFNSNGGSGELSSPIFDSGKPPVSISVKACQINWPTTGDLVATNPPESPACTGGQTTITLTPFGATKLRMSEFPTFKSSSGVA